MKSSDDLPPNEGEGALQKGGIKIE